VYKILSKLVDKCWRYSKPNQCHFWSWLKRPIFGVLDSQGSPKTLVRRGGITNYHLIAYSFSNISAKKLSKSVYVHWSYSVERHCRFFWDTVYIPGLLDRSARDFYSMYQYIAVHQHCDPRIHCRMLVQRMKVKQVNFFQFTEELVIMAIYLEQSQNKCQINHYSHPRVYQCESAELSCQIKIIKVTQS